MCQQLYNIILVIVLIRMFVIFTGELKRGLCTQIRLNIINTLLRFLKWFSPKPHSYRNFIF